MKKINIGILGLGTVGGGTYDILRMNKDLITRRTGVDYEVTRILEINMKSIESHGVDRSIVTDNVDDVLAADDVDIVVESLGGIEPATSFMAHNIGQLHRKIQHNRLQTHLYELKSA